MAWRERSGIAMAILMSICAVTVTGLVVRRELFGARQGESSNRAPREPRTLSAQKWQAAKQGVHRLGPDNAKVTIVEFADFECPACGSFEAHALRFVRDAYPQDVAIVFRHWPLPYHRFAYPAAKAAECAEFEGHFREFHDLLYNQQDSLGLKTFRQFGVESGISNLERFDACLSKPGQVAVIDSDAAFAKTLDSPGTPTLVINGILLGSVPDSAQLVELVKTALRGGGS